MQFSDTSTYNGLVQLCEDYTNLGDGAISGNTSLLKKFTVHINNAERDVVREILLAQDDFDWDDSNRTNFPIGTFPLTTNRDYNLPSSLGFLKLKRVDISYDGVNYVKAEPVDSAQIPSGLGNDDTVDGFYSRQFPRYDAKANGFWLYPRATASDVSAGAKARIEFVRAIDPFAYTDTTQEPGIDENFHELIAIGASLKYAVTKDAEKAKNLKVLYDEGIKALGVYYSQKDRDAQLVLNPEIPNYA